MLILQYGNDVMYCQVDKKGKGFRKLDTLPMFIFWFRVEYFMAANGGDQQGNGGGQQQGGGGNQQG